MEPGLDHFGVLQVEPTDRCNLACGMCLPHHEGRERIHGVPKGMMDLDLFRRIVDGLVEDDARFDHVILQWLGEPSLHPRLEEMIAIARDGLGDRAGYLRVDTNAILLGPRRMDRIVELYAEHPEQPLLMVFSIDAARPETYRLVKGRPMLDLVRRNVRHLVMRRARLEMPDVRLNVQLQLVLQEGNAAEAGEFVRYWSDFLRCHGGGRGFDEVMVKRLSVAAGGKGQAEADRLYERTCLEQGIAGGWRDGVHVRVWSERPWQSTAGSAPRQPCPALWATPVIRHDGHLLMCCADLEGELDLGSLARHGFRELWEGPEAVRRRLAHVRGAFGEVGPCAGCGGINWYRTSPELVRAWLLRTGYEDLWGEYRSRMETG